MNLPEEFYKEEVRNDYKISSEMKKIWSIELDLFNQLDRICKKHNKEMNMYCYECEMEICNFCKLSFHNEYFSNHHIIMY